MDSFSLIDQAADFLVGPHQIAFDITNKCNLRCLHCYNNSGENAVSRKELTDEQVMAFIDDAAEMRLFNFCFCGGETLLRKNLVYRAAERLKAKGVNTVSLVTNGLLLDRDTASRLKESGIDRLQLSIDGARAASHDRLRNKQGAYEKVIEALHLLKELGMYCSVAFTPTSFNIEEFTDVYRMLKEVGVTGELRCQPLMPIGRADDNEESIKPTEDQYRRLVREINHLTADNASSSVTIQWGDPIDHLIRYRKKINRCVNHCVVRANGDIAVSAYLPLIVGNVRRHPLSEYWNAGLGRIWEKAIPNEFAKTLLCMEDMKGNDQGLPVAWKDGDLYLDMLEHDLNDLRLLQLQEA
ncbi:radical SAM/SPASM domain-containing protein [Gorillibacterium sp. sgz500922]|uniref:radical SAM/SPASM domain-containing protein n=1 Tax=Gorillibacterium sp. sgz500922 TaxID=3446694 RepID=UPI003F666CE1